MNTALITTSGLCIGYDASNPLCAPADLSAFAGEVLVLLGANGVGKSTLLRTLSGEMKPLAGEVKLCAHRIDAVSRKERARRLSLVATDSTMTGALSVRELVSLGRHPYTGWTGILTGNDKRIVTSAMEDTGILYKQDALMSCLSDGERQKAMIARALAQDTDVMMLDEPLAFLDPAARIEIFYLLQHIATERGKSIIISCHDVAMSLRMASRVWLFTTEKIIVQTTPQQAVASGEIDHLFSSAKVIFSADKGDFILNPYQHM